eukprot:GEZU01024245.1.p1 GENE.GEZU01024245.1~~GEZU01024245.1.p1  ORF type:complete len:366 (+),score=114.12 GEZU01024245.1:182-1279(+)
MRTTNDDDCHDDEKLTPTIQTRSVLNQYCNETAIAFHKKYKGNDEDRKKATFLIMEYTANTRHIPPQFQISALPAIVVFPRFHDNRNFEVINLMELDLAQLIKERTGLDVDKVEKKFDLGGKNDAGTPGTPKEDEKSLITNYLLVLVCFIACYVGYTLLKYLLGTSVLRYLTIFGAMVAYYLLTGGIMYNIITQAEPFFVHPQTKQMFLIFPNARRQFSVETYIVGLITFALSASFIAMHSYVVKCNQSLEKEDSSNANKEEVNKSGEDASSKNKKKKEPAASTEDVAIERAEASSSSASKDSGVGANNNNNKAPAAYEGNLPYFVGLFSIFFVGFLFLNFIHAAKLPGYLEGSWLRKALLLPDI